MLVKGVPGKQPDLIDPWIIQSWINKNYYLVYECVSCEWAGPSLKSQNYGQGCKLTDITFVRLDPWSTDKKIRLDKIET